MRVPWTGNTKTEVPWTPPVPSLTLQNMRNEIVSLVEALWWKSLLKFSHTRTGENRRLTLANLVLQSLNRLSVHPLESRTRSPVFSPSRNSIPLSRRDSFRSCHPKPRPHRLEILPSRLLGSPSTKFSFPRRQELRIAQPKRRHPIIQMTRRI